MKNSGYYRMAERRLCVLNASSKWPQIGATVKNTGLRELLFELSGVIHAVMGPRESTARSSAPRDGKKPAIVEVGTDLTYSIIRH